MRGTSPVNDSQLISNFETIPQLFTITDYLASKIANIPVKVVKKSGRPAPNSELNKLIEEPNQYQSFNELIKLFFAYYEPMGNAYLYGIKPTGMDQVTKLYCLPTDKVRIVLLRDKSLPSWMNEVAGYQVNIGGKEYNLPPDMVLHERYMSLRYDDGSWIYGMSKYIPGDAINKELKAIHEAKVSIVTQRGALGFVTNESENPDPDQSREVKEKLQSSYGLGTSQHKIIVTTEKLKWQQMALGVQELQLIENAKYSFDKLCQLSGFDPVIFSTDGSTFANKKEATKDLMLKVIKPKVDSFYKSLSAFLGEGYGGDEIVPDWSQVEELADDTSKMTDMLTKQIESMIITPKKAYEILYGDIENEDEAPPDEYFRKTSLVPVEAPETPPPADPMPGDVVDPEMVRQLAEDAKKNENENGNGNCKE